MLEQDRAKFASLLKATLDVFGKDVSPGVITVWWEALRRFEYAEVRAAFSRHIQNADSGQFAPKPADIIRTLEGDSEGRALGAWTKVLEALRKVGTWRSVVFDDPLIHAVLEDMGGWIRLGTMMTDEVPFRGQEFHKRYRALVHQPPASYPPKLLGQAEARNMMNGHESEAPMLIGEPETCQAVLGGGSATPRIPMRRADAALGEVMRQLEDKSKRQAGGE